MEALIEVCSVEYRHQVLSKKEQELRTNNFIRLALSGFLLSFVVIQPLNSFLEWGWRLAKAPTFDSNGMEVNFKELNVDKGFNRTLKEGDAVLAYKVTSVFGERIHPVTGVKKMHNGVDLDTPKGTDIYAIGKPRNWGAGEIFGSETIYIECSDDSEGGKIASVTSSFMKDYRFNFMHLESCNSGAYASGAIVATTGNSGGSTTGEHLHFEVELKGRKIDPPVGFLLWALQGKEPQLQSSTKPIVEKLRNAIAGQESGHDSKIVNTDSGALGLAQVMPENIKEWSTQCLGKPLAEKEFLASKEKQIKVIDCKLAEYLGQTRNAPDFDTQVRQVASIWYSGDATLYNNTKPQKFGNGSYPSINDYSLSTLARFKKQ
jgi:murein DD-endopeptidase MepM/ murein hydrolase activator NlpD